MEWMLVSLAKRSIAENTHFKFYWNWLIHGAQRNMSILQNSDNKNKQSQKNYGEDT